MKAQTIGNDDLKCVGCKYNLRGLSREGRCPECGRSIAESLTVRKPKSKFFFTTWGLIVLGAIHLLIAMFFIVVEGTPSGAPDAFFVLAAIDFPLSYVWGWVRGPNPSFSISGWCMAYFAIAGTVMYGLVGALLGFMIDSIRRNMRAAPQS